MRRSDFCYFHAKLHTPRRAAARRKLKFSAIEDSAGINTAVVQTLNALLAKTIDAKQAGLILYGIQIAAQKIDDYRSSPRDTVRYISRSEQGDELAPELCVKERGWGKAIEDCSECPHRDTCRLPKAGENEIAQTKRSKSNASNRLAKTPTAVSAEDPSSQPSGRRRLTLKDANEANINQVIEAMNPVTLLETCLKLESAGPPGS